MAKKEKHVYNIEPETPEEVAARRDRRNKNFRVWIEKDLTPAFPDEVNLCFTRNGFQSSSIGLLPEEINKVINCLLGHYKKKEGKK